MTMMPSSRFVLCAVLGLMGIGLQGCDLFSASGKEAHEHLKSKAHEVTGTVDGAKDNAKEAASKADEVKKTVDGAADDTKEAASKADEVKETVVSDAEGGTQHLKDKAKEAGSMADEVKKTVDGAAGDTKEAESKADEVVSDAKGATEQLEGTVREGGKHITVTEEEEIDRAQKAMLLLDPASEKADENSERTEMAEFGEAGIPEGKFAARGPIAVGGGGLLAGGAVFCISLLALAAGAAAWVVRMARRAPALYSAHDVEDARDELPE